MGHDALLYFIKAFLLLRRLDAIISIIHLLKAFIIGMIKIIKISYPISLFQISSPG